MQHRLRLCVCALVVFALARSVCAQGFVGGGVVMSIDPAGSVDMCDPHTVCNGIGGTTTGIAVAAAANLSPTMSLGGELSIPVSRIEGLQSATEFSEHNSINDLLLSLVLRRRLRQLEIVGGVDWIHETTERSVAFKDFITGSRGTFGQTMSIGRDGLGVVGGMDYLFRVLPNVFLSPGVRVHWVSRSSSGNDGALGISGVILRPRLQYASRCLARLPGAIGSTQRAPSAACVGPGPSRSDTRGLIDRRPTARPSDSSRRCCGSGPIACRTAARRVGPQRSARTRAFTTTDIRTRA